MDNSGKKDKLAPPDAGARKARGPDWAAGLKQLYDSVVEEPLPDSFKELLLRLDESGK